MSADRADRSTARTDRDRLADARRGSLYMRRVECVNGQVYNSEFEKFAAVKDPGK
jgi:hypothetical protein